MDMNGHCSHLKHFTFGRAVTKLAAKFAAVASFDVVSMATLFDGDGDDDADDSDGDEDFVDGCVESESLVIL